MIMINMKKNSCTAQNSPPCCVYKMSAKVYSEDRKRSFLK